MRSITDKLFSMRDMAYKAFQCKLMPTVNPDLVIGVRTPVLRAFAKELRGTNTAVQFISELPHKYYEENNLHGLLIKKIKDYDVCIAELNRLLPYVDNWATCDMLTPEILKRNTDKLIKQIELWLKSEHIYTVRFGIKLLMTFYLDKLFKEEYVERVLGINIDEYYIKMMQAWYIATALAKQYEPVLPYIEKGLPDKWVHNKAIQKAVESYRITEEQKTYLKRFRIK